MLKNIYAAVQIRSSGLSEGGKQRDVFSGLLGSTGGVYGSRTGSQILLIRTFNRWRQPACLVANLTDSNVAHPTCDH